MLGSEWREGSKGFYVGPCTPFLVVVDFIDSRFLESDTKFRCFVFAFWLSQGGRDCVPSEELVSELPIWTEVRMENSVF